MNSDQGSGVAARLQVITPNRGDVPKMADLTGIALTTLGNWRRGRGEPQLSEAARIARAAGVRLDWLATGEGAMRGGPEEVAATTAAADAAPTPIQEDLLENVITAIEIFLNQNNLGMHPDKKARLIVILYRIFARRRVERAMKAQEMGEKYIEPTISISGDPDIADMVRLMV